MPKIGLAWIMLILGICSAAQSEKKEVDVSGKQAWLDTGVNIQTGDTVRITATGTLKYMDAKENGPDGLARGWRDLLRQYPVNQSGRGALIGRIGDRDTSLPFLVGASKEVRAGASGRLFLGVNQPANDSGEGSYHVAIELVRSAAAASTGKVAQPAGPLPKFTQAMLDQIPTRVNDKDGNLGDRTNFVMIGTQDQVVRVFDAAGWVKVDRSVKDAVLHGLFSSLSKDAYVQLPMSELELFGRPQDYGFAHAEPISVVTTRHHLRLWKAPFAVDGQTLWVGAATHDIGFERDQRTNGITHKIDPDVDTEREYVGQSLNETGLVGKLDYLTPTTPVKDARTATGGGFHSDGRTLIIYLPPDSGKQLTEPFADLFATVLKKENPDTGPWGDASQYLETPAKNEVPLPEISTQYRILIVPGFMSACASSAPAFQEGVDHLTKQHNLVVERMDIPNDSSEENGKRIADYIKQHMLGDSRKYIVVGYSKGAPDTLTMLAQDKDAAASVAAFVSVAGAVGGSPIVDSAPASISRYTQQIQFGKCQGDVAAAVNSLRRDVRQAFLASHPDPGVPAYSLVAISDKTNTSKALLQSWQLMQVYDTREDSQLTAGDATVPGSKYLGAAKCDHLAVALPFEKSSDASIKKVIDHGHYPRATLLESLVRFVVQDLQAK